jgi:hypothetical protein
LQSSLKTGWLLVVVVTSGLIWSGCFDPPELPSYVTEMADLDDPNVTKTEWEAQQQTAAVEDINTLPSEDSATTEDDAVTVDDAGPVAPPCVGGELCDSDDPDECLDDITTCEGGTQVCVDRVGFVCAIGDECVEAGQHNPENTCEVCTPGESGATADTWTAIDTGKLCDDRGLFGLCEADGLGGIACTERPDWLFCDIAVPPLADQAQCQPFQPWGGSDGGEIRFVHTTSSDNPLCPNGSIDATLKDALERDPQDLKWGSVILLGDGEHQACDLVIPAGVTVRSVSGAAATDIVPEPGGCDQAILRAERGSRIDGLSLVCDTQEGCADLTLLKLAGGESDDLANVSYCTFTGGKRGISTEVGSYLANNTFYNGKSGVVVESAAAESEITIHSSLFWSLSAHGISAEATTANVTAQQNVYIKTSNPTKQVTDPSSTANGENISGAEFDTETYTAKDANTLSELIEQGADNSDVGATQSSCGWDVRPAPFRCAHAVGTTNHCLANDGGTNDEPTWLGQVGLCAEVDEFDWADLQDALDETFGGPDPVSGELLLEPGFWNACDLNVPEGVFLVGAAGPEQTVIRCGEPLSEGCTSPEEGAARDCPESRVLILGAQSGLTGVTIEVVEQDMGGAMVPAVKLAGAEVHLSHVRIAGHSQGVGIELSLPKLDAEGAGQASEIHLEHLSLGEHHRAIWLSKPESDDAASTVQLNLRHSVLSGSDIGVAHDEGVNVELATEDNYFCDIKSGAYVTLNEAGESQTNALPTEENQIKPSCPEDWDYTESAEFTGATEAGRDLGAVQVSCDWYIVEAPESDCCYTHPGGTCTGSEGTTTCAETVCAALPECCSGATWSVACSVKAAELCAECGCVPICEGKSCGSDGCDGSCGDLDTGCEGGSACDPSTGQCACVPDCDGKSCGDDGCGDTCGDCPTEPCMVYSCGDGGTCTSMTKDCDDSDPCTTDGCEADTCTHAPVVCDDSNLCTVETCNSSTGDCDAEPVTDGVLCDDDNVATTLEACFGGQCGCTADCTGKQCGDDGCGGDCGACTTGDLCSPTACDITSSQCVVEPIDCDDDNACTNDECSDGTCSNPQIECDDFNPCTNDTCFEDTGVCVAQDVEDGTVCDDEDDATIVDTCISGECKCMVQCVDKACGDDGCGGSCGACTGQDTCNETGQCVCQPSCAEENACGDDGCDGDCGACQSGESWNCEMGQCVCQPSCAEENPCGDDGCGGDCGACTGQDTCNETGQCVCQPSCAEENACGDDGCDGPCGDLDGGCEEGSACDPSTGQCACVPDCDGKICGDNGCGGTCGACAPGVDCVANQCVANCTPDCTDKECGSDGCNGTCGDLDGGCPTNEWVVYQCEAGNCYPVEECIPSCGGVNCGSDGCDGSCGDCAEGNICLAGSCTECTPFCDATSICGPDGCGGTCGDVCTQGHACEEGTSCIQATACDFEIRMTAPEEFTVEVSWALMDSDETIITTGAGYTNSATYITTVQLTTGAYILRAIDSYGDGWSDGGADDPTGLVISHLHGESNGISPVLSYTMSTGLIEDTSFVVSCVDCIDSCDGSSCGPSGCGGTCGACPGGTICAKNPLTSPAVQCVSCTPDCGGQECGQDGCGGVCGATGLCPTGETCNSGSCGDNGTGPGPGCDEILDAMPRLPLPADSCNAIAGVPEGNNVHHVSSATPEWCPECDPDTLMSCGVWDRLDTLFDAGEVASGDVVLVHPGEYYIENLQIPAGVHVRAVEGPTQTHLNIAQGYTEGIVLNERAVLEGFWITATEPSTVTTFVDMMAASSGVSAGNRLEFNIIGGEGPHSQAFTAVSIRGPGSEVFHNTFIYAEVGANFDAGVTLAGSQVIDNLFYDVSSPAQNHPTTSSCSADFCVGTSTPCSESIDCSILMSPQHNHVFCPGNPNCTGADPQLGMDYLPSQGSPLIGASTVTGKDVGAMQTGCGWSGCTSNCDTGGSSECTLEVFSFTADEICSPVDFGESPVRTVVDPANVGADTVAACEAYTDLKEALDASSTGDVVLVFPGNYVFDDCSQSEVNDELSALVVPAGVRLMSTHGAAQSVLHVGNDCTDFMQVMEGATVEGFKFFGPSDPYTPETTLASIRGSGSTFRFNVLYGEEHPFNAPGGSDAWALQVDSSGATITHNTFVNQMTGIEFTEPNGLETSVLKDNIFQDVGTPVWGVAGVSDASGPNLVYCPSSSDPAPTACKLQNPQLNPDTFEPTEASEALVIGQASDALDMGAVQVSCEWSITNPSQAGSPDFDWTGCEQAAEVINGCSWQSPLWSGEDDQTLEEYGLCVNHDDLNGQLSLALAASEGASRLILSPGEWTSCGLTLPANLKVLSAMGPKHTQLVCKTAPSGCTTHGDPDCPVAGVVQIADGGAGLSGFTVECSAAGCPFDTPAIAMTGPDSMLSHLVVTAEESTGIKVKLPTKPTQSVLHLSHLSILGNTTGIIVEHPTSSSYENLKVNIHNSVFAKNLWGILHQLMSSEEPQDPMGGSINAGNVLMSLGMPDEGHVQLSPSGTSEDVTADDLFIDQASEGITFLPEADASSEFIQWADGGYQDPNFPLPPEIAGASTGGWLGPDGPADLGAIQDSCNWIEAVEGSIDGECALGDSECVHVLNQIDDAICIATYDLGFTFPDAISAGHYLRAVIDNLVNDGVLEAVIRIGDGDWDVCTASSPTEYSDNTVDPGLRIPSGYVIRADNGPSATRITCPAIPNGAELEEIVRIDPSGGLVGVDVDCGVLCEVSNSPTIRVALAGPPLGLGADPLPALVSYVSATGGSGGPALQIESHSIVDHCQLFDGTIGMSVVVTGTTLEPSPNLELTNTIFSNVETSYWVHNGNWTEAGIAAHAYTLEGIQNYVCGALVHIDTVRPEAFSSMVLEEAICGESGCVSSPPEGWVTNIPSAGCALYLEGTPVEDATTEVNKPTHIGPMQGNGGCAYPLVMDED